MICPSCGRNLDDDVNFCYYCGHSFRQNINTEEIAKTAVRYDMQKAQEMAEEDQRTPMKTWQWVLYFMTLLIPYLWLVWFIITIVWAVGNKGTKERRNIAKALLIGVLLIVLFIAVAGTLLIQSYGVDGAVSRLTNGMYNSLDEYMNAFGGGTAG